jgi:hypothetical protein
VTTDPLILNHTVGIAPFAIWNDLGSGTAYGSSATPSGAVPLPTDIFTFQLNSSAVVDLNNAIGVGFFSVGASKDGWDIFSSSGANGNQQLVLETTPISPVPLPPSIVSQLVGLVLLSVLVRRRKREAQAAALSFPSRDSASI